MHVLEQSAEQATLHHKIIDGKMIAEQLKDSVKVEATTFKQTYDRAPGLAVVLVGSDPASQVYVGMKLKQAKAAGITSYEHRLEATAQESDLLALLDQLNTDDQVDGILVQLPLPGHMDESKVITSINPLKDVDGFHPYNVGLLSIGRPTFVPCTPLGCLMMLKQKLPSLAGLKAVVVGRSNIVGKPMAALLTNESCSVTVLHSKSKNIAAECREADILVVATGRPEMVGADHIKPGAIVLDVGINRITDAEGQKRLVGDVDFGGAVELASAITPVPGGVGPMTVACLMKNTISAAYRRKQAN